MSDQLTSLSTAVDLAAAAVFAVTGALVASRKKLDIVGFMWLGVVTGVGGGTVRDLLLAVPVFWVRDATPVIACLLAAIATYFTAHLVHSRYRVLLWLNAIGLALVTIVGTAKGLDAGAGSVIAVVMGVFTAAVGGIIRDILGQGASIILRREIYVTASLIGAVTFVVLNGTGLDRSAPAICAGVAAFTLRRLAIFHGWSLPTYRARQGRHPDEVDPLVEGPAAV